MTLWDIFETEEAASLPYNGSSGWSGSATSKQRADTRDKEGTTSEHQRLVLTLLRNVRGIGMTWREISGITGWHHGVTSGLLSNLHKDNRIARLAQSRDRCRVYVMPEWVEGRDTEGQGRQKACPHCGGAL